MNKLSIYIVSDSLGETGVQVANAAIAQFNIKDFEIKRFPYVLNVESLQNVLDEASQEENVVIIYTLVDKKLLKYMENKPKSNNIIIVDLLSPLLNAIETTLDMEAKREPGAVRKLDENYFKRVEAIEFAVKYDDGKDPMGILTADVVIIGISRTSKTPLCMYLANKNIRAANIPLVPESELPKEVFEISRKKIIGLTNSPIKLNEIRKERAKALGIPNSSNYASLERILYEIDYAEGIMKKIGCPVIDVSTKAIEETAELVINYLNRSRVNLFDN